MKIAFVYTGFTSYMTDCWRCLARQLDVQVRIWLEDTKHYRFMGDRDALIRGLDITSSRTEDFTDDRLSRYEREIADFNPDVLFVCGWSRRLPPFVTYSRMLEKIPKVLELDMQWEWSLRKIFARIVLYPYLRRYSAVFVPGESTARYARWLGFPEKRIYRGRNSIDLKRMRPAAEANRTGFVFLGRHSSEKGIDVLEQAHAQYCKEGGDWGLIIPGFIEPREVPGFLSHYACLVLPSRWEPWGVVVLEALAAGMRVIVSDRVGARLDLPVDRVVPHDNVSALARAMHEIEREGLRIDDVPCEVMGYSCERWAETVLKICHEIR
ncbi:MAG: glycosyltransferase family 4 protein [Kiritimatiellia bacterium]